MCFKAEAMLNEGSRVFCWRKDSGLSSRNFQEAGESLLKGSKALGE